ncbi:ribonuclease P protein subunit p25-like protein isoform X1 [Neodiprion pinetum]|uniref:Ribonuclease P protein subunit p25-like protein isoform X1 n=2 Tax=Neodiprion lecontei TaxID=441921 RepID=A0ABM3G9U2_NEOLC|nr:ribonuclease P protein subunit p25-like protein isoform X1 [Neodiprion pinetum]XP_046597038.1 ribonuclease P protein subunit p25-like protein isoform X1 [Neodiprion lecontei]
MTNEMARKSRSKKKLLLQKSGDVVKTPIPIPNLPEKFLWMHVNSGTKIKNVLSYALKEIPGYNCIVWSGAGQGIGKVITCAEICKRNHPSLHQITKLRYVKSKKAAVVEKSKGNMADLGVPELHILLSKDPLDSRELGHQSSIDEPGMFSSRRSDPKTSGENDQQDSDTVVIDGIRELQPSTSKLSSVATEEFAAMGLRTAQKRTRKGQRASETSSGSKSRKKGKA